MHSTIHMMKEVFQSHRDGIIKLVPKKDAEPHLIKNWWPLTLLNCDYKIAGKAIANRIKSVIPKLINNDQTSFLKDKANRVVYQKLLSFKSTVPFKSQGKWNDSIRSDERCSADWTSAYCLAARCTKSTKLVNFQFRFLHRILPTNLFFNKN